MAKKEDDSSLKDNLSSAFDGKDKYEKDGGGHESYREWDSEKLIASIRNLTESGFPAVGEEAMEALKVHGVCGRDVASWTKESLEQINIRNNKDQILLLGFGGTVATSRLRLPHCDYKIINDPIHGHIQLSFTLMRIIDTLQFQRLRDIKQLGCTYRVFPGASHNRFEHSIGVCHLAGELVEALSQTQPELGITEEDILCVKIAGLCYNLGHGPFSKVFSRMCEKQLHEKYQMEWRVEAASVVMFRHLIAENPSLKGHLEEKGIREEQLDFIESLIDPESPSAHRKNGSKQFLRDIVKNHKTCIDVDTMDSIARDSYLLNVPCTFDHKRIVKFVQVNEVSGSKCLCFRDKEAQDLYDMLLSKLNLQRKAYKHKTVRLIEQMLERALVKADAYLKLTETACDLLSGDAERAQAAARKYTRLTDYVKDRIMDTEDDSLKESRELLQNIETRKLYKLVGIVLCATDKKHQDAVSSAVVIDGFMKMVREEFPISQISEEDVLIDKVEFRFGTELFENPIEHIQFYSKNDSNRIFSLRKEQVSLTLPERFTDVVVRVYSKVHDEAFASKVEEVFKRSVQQNTGLVWDYTPYASPRKSDASPRLATPKASAEGSPSASAKRNIWPKED